MADVASKLQLKGGAIRLLNAPEGVDLGLAQDVQAAAVLLFVRAAADLDDRLDPVLQAAKEDALAWVAYPKAGQLGTDLNRDTLAAAMRAKGVRPVRQVSLDEVWSALRFRGA